MERLEIRLLGGFQLGRDGRPLEQLPLRAARSLFAYLVLNRERSHTRDLLAGTFWPDFDESRARRRLSQALWQTQKTLGEKDGQRYLIGTPDTIRFNPDADFWLDVDEFLAALDEATDAERSTEIRVLTRAVELYRGDLLAGFYDDWLFPDQDRLRTKFLTALERLADLAMARGDYETALTLARRLAQENEFDEESHRRVMRVAVLLGRHNEALRQFEECRRILAEELGTDPSAETLELYEATLADRDAGGRATPVHDESPLFGEAASAPFVGRDTERARLAQRLDEVLEGRGGIVLVEGESGVGKTRLLREVVGDAQWRGMDVVWGRSAPSGGRPFGPIGDALRSGLSDLRIRQLENRLDDTRIATLAPLMPRLRPEAAPEAAMGLADEQARMHEAIGAAFQALAATSPTLVVLEDVHWADEDTIQALSQIAHRIQRDRILFAVTYRHGEARERSEVWDLLRTLDRLEYCERLSLAALTPAQAEELIRKSLGHAEISASFSERLHRDTGGIPLFIVEALRAHYEMDALSEATSPSEEVPSLRETLPITPTVHSLMKHRLQALDPQARRTLELLSAHDDALQLEEVVAASELTEESALSAMDELQRRRFTRSDDGLFSIDHDLMRRIVYDDLPVSRRLDLHRRLALAIEMNRPDEVELLAHHFAEARMPELAAQYLETAAERAMNVHAYDTAAQHLSRASQMLDEIGAPRDKKYVVAALHEEVLDVLGRRDEQESILQRMTRLAPESERGDVLRRKAWWLAHQDRVQDAERTAAKAFALAEASSDPGRRVEALTALGMISCYVGQAAKGVLHLERAAEFRGADMRQVADARNALGHNLIDLQRFDEAKSHLLAALDLYRDLADARGQAEVLGTLGTMRMERGDPDSAEADFEQAIEISRKIGYRHGEAVYRMNLGILYVITNRIGAAIDAFHEAHSSYSAMSNRRGKALVLSNSAWLWHGLIGDDTIAADQIREARSIYETIGDERGMAQCEGLLGSILGRQGNLRDAREMYESALERTIRLADSWLTAQALREYAASELENDSVETGLDHILRAERLCREYGLNDLLVGVRALAGRLLLRVGRTEEALDWTSRAMREIRRGVELAHLVPLALSEVHEALDNRSEAAHYITLAFEQLERMLSDLDPENRDRAWSLVPNHRQIKAKWGRIAPEKRQFSLASVTAPLGRPLRDTDIITVDWTIHDPVDDEAQDPATRRGYRILRLLAEAEAAGAAPTVENLAEALNVSVATIRRELASLRATGRSVSTRGSR